MKNFDNIIGRFFMGTLLLLLPFVAISEVLSGNQSFSIDLMNNFIAIVVLLILAVGGIALYFNFLKIGYIIASLLGISGLILAVYILISIVMLVGKIQGQPLGGLGIFIGGVGSVLGFSGSLFITIFSIKKLISIYRSNNDQKIQNNFNQNKI